MRSRQIAVFLLFLSTVAFADGGKGICPPTPPRPTTAPLETPEPSTSPSPDAKYAGTVVIMAVISDKGFVCDGQIIRGVGKEIDKAALEDLRKARFNPARKGKQPVPVVITLQVAYWHKNGRLIQFPPMSQTQNMPAH